MYRYVQRLCNVGFFVLKGTRGISKISLRFEVKTESLEERTHAGYTGGDS